MYPPLASSCLVFQWLACTHLFFSFAYTILPLTTTASCSSHLWSNLTSTVGLVLHQRSREIKCLPGQRPSKDILLPEDPLLSPAVNQRTLLTFPASSCTRGPLSQTSDLNGFVTHQLQNMIFLLNTFLSTCSLFLFKPQPNCFIHYDNFIHQSSQNWSPLVYFKYYLFD